MTAEWITEVKRWLSRLPDATALEAFAGEWDSFADEPQPVLTLFGAYDTGKSALLRRLLVDAGCPVPDWVTISARHETFEVNQVDLLGCTVRDTPGIVAEASDVRGESNTQRALQAVGLTDIAVITVGPQLPTAERDALRDLVSQRWGLVGLWVVITRFDEAGIDPLGDPDGYRDLARRKEAELRTSLDLDHQAPVFVVTQDYGQLAGFERNPEPATWEITAEWDGIAELLRAIESVGQESPRHLRKDSELRFWRNAIIEMMGGLGDELDSYRTDLRVAEEGVATRQSWLRQLEVITDAARASIGGTIEEAIRSTVNGQINDPEVIAQSVGDALDLWAAQQDRRLTELAETVDVTTRRNTQRPSWSSLESLLSRLNAPNPRQPQNTPTDPTIAPRVDKLRQSLLESIRSYETISNKRLKDSGSSARASSSHASEQLQRVAKSGTSRAEFFRKSVDVVDASGPFLVAALAEAEASFRQKRAAKEEKRRREEFEALVTETAEKAADLAYASWLPQSEALRNAIMDVTEDQSLLQPGLAETVALLETSVAEGTALLEASTRGITGWSDGISTSTACV